MNSPHQREQLPDLLSDALTKDERARVESHLRECAQCARELRQLEQVQAAVAALPAAPVPVSVRANVRAQLRTQPQSAFALPFAFPLKTRQLAWGGAAVVGAIGLMLLGRPSLQNDSPAAPVSETDLAAGAAQSDGAADMAPAPATSANGTATPPKSAAPKPTKPKVPPIDLNRKVPRPIEQLPPLPAPPSASEPNANAPSGSMPSFAFPAAPAPLAPSKTEQSNSRPVAPNGLEAKPKAKTKKESNVNSEAANAPAKPTPRVTKMGPQGRNAPKISQSPATSSADNSSAFDSSVSRSTIPMVPPMGALPAPSMDFPDGIIPRAGSAKATAPQPPRAMMPDRAMKRNAPAPAQTDRAKEATGETSTAEFAAPAKWPGGAVKSSLGSRVQTRRDDEAPGTMGRFGLAAPPKFPLVLTFSVANPIGRARLILLTPNGEQTIWRGELNALPAQIELSQAIIEKASGKTGKTLRARLEQIGGDDNPISSSTFELLVP